MLLARALLPTTNRTLREGYVCFYQYRLQQRPWTGDRLTTVRMVWGGGERGENEEEKEETYYRTNTNLGRSKKTLQLLKTCTKGSCMNCWETLFIQEYHRKGTIIAEQQLFEYNTLYDLIQETDRDTKTGIDSSVQNHIGQRTHHQHKGNTT